MAKRRVKAFGRYYKCSECGKAFKIMHAPLKELHCPRCNSTQVYDIDRKEYLLSKGGV